MIANIETLRQKARELALEHAPHASRRLPAHLWHDFEANLESLHHYALELQDRRASCSQPAEEWLLDNTEFLSEQALSVQNELTDDLLRRLPQLRRGAELRVMSICIDYLEQVDCVFDVESFTAYLTAYQEVSVLTIAEAWSVPQIMRMAIIRKLADAMEPVRERREVCAQVERFLSRIDPAALRPEVLNAVLDEAGQDMPLSGPWIVHLISHLREWADDSSAVREWLSCKLENDETSIDNIVTYEHRLQAAYQVTAGNLITSMRIMSRLDWHEPFERICIVERTLREESAGMYPMLDFSSRDLLRKRVEEIARSVRVPENLAAKQAVELAARADADDSSEERRRQCFAAYYLLEPNGIRALHRALKSCSKPRSMPKIGITRRAKSAYFSMLALLFAVILLGFTAWAGAGSPMLTAAQWTALAIVLLLPASEWAVAASHQLIEFSAKPRPLLRYDFTDGIPEDAATIVVIPVIWSTPDEAHEMADRLELHYLANRESNMHFALLGDFADSDRERLPGDEPIVAAATAKIHALNEAYGAEEGPTFHLFQRRRQYNASEKAWMGWERKRGKLVEFVELLGGKSDTSYDIVVGDAKVLPKLRYIITLDADTQLPIGTAQRMISTMHLPFNRPRYNKNATRIVEGFGVLQPRIAMSHESAHRSRLAALWSGEPGIDPYAFSISDPYQDGFGQGIFTGKGIIDIQAFSRILCERIPDNYVLSHDLLEGGFLRTGLLSDIELIDDHPAAFNTYQKRMHRWIRGDWQLLCWLYPRVCDRSGASQPVDLSALTRWQIVDNMRRSLLIPGLFALFALALTVLPGSPARLLTIGLATLFLSFIRQLLTIHQTIWRPKQLGAAAAQCLIVLWTMPFQTVLLLDAIGRSLYRSLVSKRRMLEWVSSAEVERRSQDDKQSLMQFMTAGYVLIAAFVMAVMFAAPELRAAGFALAALWALAPLAVLWLNGSAPVTAEALPPEAQTRLRELAKQIWSFFEDTAGEQDHYLPPDNIQIDPPNGVAHRTSPTNIGLLVTCCLSARDFEFIDTKTMIERIERTISTVERLVKWNGHLYNWYNTTTLKPLSPAYVSTVDSGNFVSYLIAVKVGLLEWLEADFSDGKNEVASDGGNWRERGLQLADRIEKIIHDTDFRPLYDHKAKLFVLGYHVDTDKRETILYDLLASEARQASFIAIALGQVSVSHWFALGRTLTKIGNQSTLISWSGTMFEYLMPWLIMRTYQNTLWDNTYRGVVRRQIEYARGRGVPFGISESGYYAFDYQMNYQYRAFGVPGLGFKRGLDQDLVISPYASILALPFAVNETLSDLDQLEQIGARGKYGFFEAIDYTTERMPKGRSFMIVRSFMAHHQGMSMLTLSNLLLPRKLYDRFHQDKRVQSASLLLKERMPARPAMMKTIVSAHVRSPEDKPMHAAPLREFADPITPSPEVSVMSNGQFLTAVTNGGGGFTRFGRFDVSRWREDPVLDDWGHFVYIRDVTEDKLWSPSYQPCCVPSSDQRVQFSLEKATFIRQDGHVRTSMEICVSPESNADIRRITLENVGTTTQIIEATTYCELALAPHAADLAHPAFNKLFIETEYDSDAECLLARRRPRDEAEKPIWAVHALASGDPSLGPVEYETDRAAFIGRGHTIREPQSIRSRLGGTVGSVVDPAFVMRRRLTIEPGQQVQLYSIMAIADSKDEAIGTVRQLSANHQIDRAFQLAWTRSQIELQHLHMTAADASLFQQLAGRALYTPPLKPERSEMIALNSKGQSELWKLGISGDIPIILARIDDVSDISFVNKLLTGHEYLRRRGLEIDLVILNESSEGYQQSLQDSLRYAVEHGVPRYGDVQNRVYIFAAKQLSEEDRTLLFAVSRMTFNARGPSLRAQLKLARMKNAWPKQLEPTAPVNRYSSGETDEMSDKALFNGWGGFSPDGGEYIISLKNRNYLPGPWINVLANPGFGCFVSELYTGYSWWRNSRECKLTPWSNDTVIDRPGEVCYLRDEDSGEYWTPTPPRGDMPHPYTVSHRPGFSQFKHSRHGVEQEMTVFVPNDHPLKIIKLTLRNTTSEQRRLSVTYYAEWVLGVGRQANAPFVVTEWDEEANVLLACNTYQETFREAVAFLGVYPAGTQTEETMLSWTSDRVEFIGRGGSWNEPAAMARESLSETTGVLHDPCGAVQAAFTMAPGAEHVVYVVFGCDSSKQSAVRLAEMYSDAATCEREFTRMLESWDDVLEHVTVKTPSFEMNAMMNNWLLYQSLACRLWARTAFYQAGGAYGYRDQLQDSLSLLHVRPEIAHSQILRCASHQYEEGDVQHWWHEETERGIRTRFSDDLLWLPYVTARYIEHTEDTRLLDEEAPYLHSEPLRDGEHERYEPTVKSGRVGTVFEHCIRAIERSLRFGEHGLPLIGIGDWNDGMNWVGPEGRGESVWLGWFQCDVLRRFADLCERRGDGERAARYRAVRETIAEAIDQHGWDGQWYRRAYTDSGQWLGSIHNAECRIDAIAQSWSIISGAAPKIKTIAAMQSFDRELVDRHLGVAALLTPPFDRSQPSPGYIQGYPPGIRENGAQYTHGVIWSIVAWCMLQNGDKAFELFDMLSPINHTRTPGEVRKYVGEPYVMAADIYTANPHKGHAGWTWYTGAAGWYYQAGLEWILGFKRRGDRLYVRPCIPNEWPEFSVSYRFGSSRYNITVHNVRRDAPDRTAAAYDFVSYTEKDGYCIELKDDGQVRDITLSLAGPKPQPDTSKAKEATV